MNIAAAGRDLTRVQVATSDTTGPVGRQGAMRRSGHWIFRDTEFRRKKPRNKVNLGTRGRDDHRISIELRQVGKIRRQLRDFSFGAKHRNIVARRGEYGLRGPAQGCGECGRCRYGRSRHRRKVHLQLAVLASHREFAATARLKKLRVRNLVRDARK